MSSGETLTRILFRVVQQYFPAKTNIDTTRAWINVHLTPSLLSHLANMLPFEKFMIRRFFRMFRLTRKLDVRQKKQETRNSHFGIHFSHFFPQFFFKRAAAELREQMNTEVLRNLMPLKQFRYFERAPPEEQELIKATAATALAYKPQQWLESHMSRNFSSPLQQSVTHALYNEVHDSEIRGARARARWGRAVDFLNFEHFLLEPTSLPPPMSTLADVDTGLWTVSLNIGEKNIGIGQADNLEDAIFDLAYQLLDPSGALVAHLPEATVTGPERADLIEALRKKREQDSKSNDIRNKLNRIADAKSKAKANANANADANAQTSAPPLLSLM